jgi:hypothetical protein
MFIYHDLQYVVVPPSHNISRFSGELKKVYLIKKTASENENDLYYEKTEDD